MRTLLIVLALMVACPAHALILDSGDGSGNTSAPADDPGFANVGWCAGAQNVVYLGNRWVVSPVHVAGTGCDVVLGGVTYQWDDVPGLIPFIPNWSPPTPTDLVLFRITTDPGLPSISLASSVLAPGTAVVLIATGRQRGTSDVIGGVTCWHGIENFVKRWGTNVITTDDDQWMETTFDSGLPTEHEAHGVVGDSGGAVFAKVNGEWVLAGLFMNNTGPGASTDACYTGYNQSVSIRWYRDELLKEMGLASPLAPWVRQ